ncbi:cytochrome C [Hydrogenimonas urashimensis]|uniref:cytochrome C n=1 Tax=Hydrogenimonas urashimensis TaxID=2740515 RepID=UPI0019156EB8|nr:cytochrome C [Hydrogenimonas urashimensis]
MKKLLTVVAAGFVAMSLMATSASADAAKGQKVYSKKLKNACGFNGAKFAAKHSQDEWEELKEEGKFADEIKKICPRVNIESIKKYLDDLYDFAYEYANDSGNVPAC